MGKTDEEIIESLFTYHAPDEEQIAKLKRVRDAARSFATVLFAECPSSADRSAAIRKLRETVQTANCSIIFRGEF